MNEYPKYYRRNSVMIFAVYSDKEKDVFRVMCTSLGLEVCHKYNNPYTTNINMDKINVSEITRNEFIKILKAFKEEKGISNTSIPVPKKSYYV